MGARGPKAAMKLVGAMRGCLGVRVSMARETWWCEQDMHPPLAMHLQEWKKDDHVPYFRPWVPCGAASLGRYGPTENVALGHADGRSPAVAQLDTHGSPRVRSSLLSCYFHHLHSYL